jgi:hypothetical protein
MSKEQLFTIQSKNLFLHPGYKYRLAPDRLIFLKKILDERLSPDSGKLYPIEEHEDDDGHLMMMCVRIDTESKDFNKIYSVHWCCGSPPHVLELCMPETIKRYLIEFDIKQKDVTNGITSDDIY